MLKKTDEPTPKGAIREADGDNRPKVFLTTHWTVVLEAGGQDTVRKNKALAHLCESYWYPIYAFLRRMGRSSHDAQDLTQGFFETIIGRDGFKSADPGKGKFRTFLLTSLKNYLSDDARRKNAAKRGGNASVISIHGDEGEKLFNAELQDNVSPDKQFERSWAIVVLRQVMDTLTQEQGQAGKRHVFEKLKPCLGKESAMPPYRELADELSMTEEAVKKTVQRLRQRFGFLLRSQIAATLGSNENVDDEIAGLFRAWQ